MGIELFYLLRIVVIEDYFFEGVVIFCIIFLEIEDLRK